MRGTRAITISGDRSTGKTHAAVAAILPSIAQGRDILWVSSVGPRPTQEYVFEILRGWNSGEPVGGSVSGSTVTWESGATLTFVGRSNEWRPSRGYDVVVVDPWQTADVRVERQVAFASHSDDPVRIIRVADNDEIASLQEQVDSLERSLRAANEARRPARRGW